MSISKIKEIKSWTLVGVHSIAIKTASSILKIVDKSSKLMISAVISPVVESAVSIRLSSGDNVSIE